MSVNTNTLPSDRVYPSRLAQVFGVTKATISTWQKKGYFDKGPDGKVNLREAAEQILARKPVGHWKQRLAASDSRHSAPDLAAEKLRHERAKADLAELAVEEKRGTLVNAEEAARAWADMTSRVRERLLAVPIDVAGDVAASEDVAECEVIIKAAITRALEALAESAPGL